MESELFKPKRGITREGQHIQPHTPDPDYYWAQEMVMVGRVTEFERAVWMELEFMGWEEEITN